MSARVLVIDDEPAIRRLIRGAAERGGYQIDEATNASEGLARACDAAPDLILLDLGLPDRDGMELVPLLKRDAVGVIVLTARDATNEKVTALDLGADDYVVKPFDTEELLARIRTTLRHCRADTLDQRVFNVGRLRLDIDAHRLTCDGVDTRLTRKEFALLAELMRHAGKVLTHAHLLRQVWGEAHVTDVEYLRVAVRGLRGKIETDSANPLLITNEPGVGYRLNG